MNYDPELVARTQISDSWSALARADIDIESAVTWDRDLLREPRVLVPLDVQAYVVAAAGRAESLLRLPSPLTPGAPAGIAGVQGPPPFDPGSPRAAGVHLHWALPDSLLRGSFRDPRRPGDAATAPPTGPTRQGGGLGLPPLPDRWAVLRLVAAAGASRVAVRGWVLDAAAATAWELPAYPSGAPIPPRPGEAPAPAVPREGLTGAAGGTLTWTGGYDASFGRFAWHDPLDDLGNDPTLAGALPGGAARARASYLIVGWWSDAELDPLDRVRTEGGLTERLADLGWRLLPGGGTESQEREGAASRAATVGLAAAQRWDTATITAVERASALLPHTGLAGGIGDLVADASAIAPARPVGAEASTLLHGAVVGVPVAAAGGGPDLRPPAASTRMAFGDSLDELVATLAASGVGSSGEQRATLERLLWAFSARLLAQLGTPDGIAELDEARHAAAFTSVDPGEPPETDRVRTGRAAIPPRTRRTGGVVSEPGTVTLKFADRKVRGYLRAESKYQTYSQSPKSASPPPPSRPPDARNQPGEEVIERPAQRRYVPSDPVLAVAGVGRNLRHGGDGRWSADGRLGVRRPSHVAQDYAGLVRGSDVLPSLGSGALPPEALALAREVIMLSPHLASWLSGAGREKSPHLKEGVVHSRIAAEMALRYDDTGAYTAASGFAVSAKPQPSAAVHTASPGYARLAAERARRHSLLDGVEPDPVGITSWAQPWVPMWLEYEIAIRGAAAPGEIAGWRLGAVDGELVNPDDPPDTPESTAVSGRVPLTTGPAEAIAGGIARYVTEEDERDRKGIGEVDDAVRDGLHALAGTAGSLDLLGAALDGVRATLLGVPGASVRMRNAAGVTMRPTPTSAPRIVTAGPIALLRARVVDAFGRTLDLDTNAAVVPARLSVADSPATMRRPPRLNAPARCQLRLVGSAASVPDGAVPARVDEIDPAAQVNPVAGFLLPDQVDESVEFFSAAGEPLGELLVEAVGGGVVWEPAPGRPLPQDAPPAAGLAPEQAVLARLAAGLVVADAQARAGRAADAAEPAESALAAFLRAVDTTLWTVDPIAGAGTSAVGGIVGRPVAVVAATLLLDVAHDLDELELNAAQRAEREAAYRDLVRHEFAVRLGELTRTDDGLLGYFLDGDFTRFHLVDRAVADLAREAGRGRGHLGSWGETPDMPPVDPIRHPYLHAEDEVKLRPGVPRLLTLLMMPGAAVHATSGIVPRQKVRLARAWFAPGLERLSPSVRVGPVLIDPGDVRLPLVAALGDRQTLTTREGPLGWRNDPIFAATQSAVLPDRTATLREGWIRVTPEGSEGGDGGGSEGAS